MARIASNARFLSMSVIGLMLAVILDGVRWQRDGDTCGLRHGDDRGRDDCPAATTAPSAATAPASSAVTTGTVASAGSAVAGAQPKGPAACVDGSIVALGSTALQPLVDAAAKAYTTKCPNAKDQCPGRRLGHGPHTSLRRRRDDRRLGYLRGRGDKASIPR